MLKKRKNILKIITTLVIVFIFVLLIMFLSPQKNDSWIPFLAGVTAAVLFFILEFSGRIIYKIFNDSIEKDVLYNTETKYLSAFIDKIRSCYSLDDFYQIISSELEEKADCAVILFDSKRNYLLYNSPDRISSAKETSLLLKLNFPATWADGIFFLGDGLGLVSSDQKARGFFLSSKGIHFYVLCRYTKLFDESIYNELFEEFVRFQVRTTTISDLSEIAGLSTQWEQLAVTQRSFLPQEMPKIKSLSLGSYFRPLVNVSGDYYSVLPIDRQKTLVMLGDVSGKGLPAALIMGLVMNTVKIMKNKEDLISMVYAIDKSIKGMKLQDKYTVLFLGIIDTRKMTIKYINASMSDPLIISRSPEGYRIKPLESNCGVIGIIELDNVYIEEKKLFRGDLIMIATDGVSEVMNDSGIELGTTDVYTDTIKNSAAKMPEEFVNDIVNLVMDYNGDKKLHDDVTMLVAKVDG